MSAELYSSPIFAMIEEKQKIDEPGMLFFGNIPTLLTLELFPLLL